MSRPTDIGTFGEAVYEQMAPVAWDDANQDWALLIYLGAIGQMLQDLDSYSHAEPPWSSIVDINRVPDAVVSWLAQFVGVSIDPSLSYDDQRQLIRDHLGWGRGTVSALKLSIRDLLTNSRTVEIIERDTSEYHFEIITYEDETPPSIPYSTLYADYATYQAFYDAWLEYSLYWAEDGRLAVENTLLANKPAGLMMTFTVTPGSPGTYKDYLLLYLNHLSYANVWNVDETYENLYLNP